MTPFQIAKEVNKYIATVKAEDLLLTTPIKLKPLNFYSADDIKDEEVFYEYNMNLDSL